MKSNVSHHLSGLCRLGFVLGSVAGLIACDDHQSKPLPDTAKTLAQDGVVISAANESYDTRNAKSLTQTATYNALRVEPNVDPKPVPDYAKSYVGRYLTQIDCDGRFAPCTEGKSVFILTLLPDGTVHRSIVHYGKVFVNNSRRVQTESNVTYRKDRWTINPEQTELIVDHKEGAKFYYMIKSPSGHESGKIYDEKNGQTSNYLIRVILHLLKRMSWSKILNLKSLNKSDKVSKEFKTA